MRSGFVAVAAALAFGFALFDPALLADGDTYWHLAAGDWILAHGAVPLTDPFSLTRAGAPWQAHEWGCEVVMALAFRAGGWNGVVVLFAAVLGAVVAVVAWPLARVERRVAVAAVAASASCIGPSLLARPHLIALLWLALWQAALFRARERRRAPWALPALMLVWANGHASFALGLVLLGLFAVERWERAWAACLALSVGAACVTPWGPTGLAFPVALLRLQGLASIREWQPTSFATVPPIAVALVLLLVAGLSGRVRVTGLRLLIVVGSMALALRQARQQMVAGVLGGLAMARPLEAAFGTRAPGGSARGVLAGAGLAVALLAARLALPVVRGADAVSPVAAVGRLDASAPGLNAYDFGGYLIWRGLRPFVDGRADLYGDAFLQEYDRIAAGDETALRAAIARWGLRWALLPPRSAAGAALVRLGWREVFADPVAAVYAP